MSEQQSIRDDIAAVIHNAAMEKPTGEGEEIFERDIECIRLANELLASPVIRRVQAEAIRNARDELGVDISDNDSDWWNGYRGGQRRQFAVLTEYAERIERGDR